VPAHDRRQEFVFEADLDNYAENDFEKEGPEDKED